MSCKVFNNLIGSVKSILAHEVAPEVIEWHEELSEVTEGHRMFILSTKPQYGTLKVTTVDLSSLRSWNERKVSIRVTKYDEGLEGFNW